MDTPQDLRDLVLEPEVGGEVDDELSRRRYEHVMDSVSGERAVEVGTGVADEHHNDPQRR